MRTIVIIGTVLALASPMYATQPALKIEITKAEIIPNATSQPTPGHKDVRVLVVDVRCTDISGADRIRIRTDRIALVNNLGAAAAKLLLLQDTHIRRGAPGTPFEITARLLFSVPTPANEGQANTLRFAVRRYSILVTPFEWAQPDGLWEFPLSGEAGSVLVMIEGMTLGRLTDKELAHHDWGPERRERASRDHLVVKLTGAALVDGEPSASASFNLRLVTDEGDTLGPCFTTSESQSTLRGPEGFDKRTYQATFHFFDVAQVPKLSKVTVQVERPVPFEEAWIPVPWD